MANRSKVLWDEITWPRGDLGIIAWSTWLLFALLQFLSPCVWWLVAWNVHRSGGASVRARWVDGYVLLVDLLAAGLLIFAPRYVKEAPLSTATWLLIAVVVVRLVEVVQANVVRHVARAADPAPADHFRTLIMAVWNYLELAFGFAALYWSLGLLTKTTAYSESLYFSFITQLTVGYGDVTAAKRWGYVLVVLQGLVGFVFTAVLVGRFVAMFPPPKTTGLGAPKP